ncbi:alpha/beta hydrolase-fold protein [uncultured Psychroserpens sp.]|uniref:alpha/beta hydrolase n=1 Tax=uncultured Psychroserpens sp. TaxID=255436 RepID=UPI00263752CE|nr:alpha/beta hydrolase-fold protein [uncultured Psychroserpens sp.]
MVKFYSLLITLFLVFSIQAQQNLNVESINFQIGDKYSFQSDVLNEKRDILIHLPSNYDSSEKEYPVIYLLDGNNHFYHATIAVTILEENEKIPESIIVGIPNNRGTRGRDLARERGKFMQFIKNEVIDFVENKYRTNDQKTIFGHSMAGAFVLNYLATQPSLFDNYIVASPVIQILNSELLDKYENLFKQNTTLDTSIYLTMTKLEAEGERATEALGKFVEILKNKAPKSLSWKYDYIENQIHMTTPYITFYQGLAEFYKNYNVQ